MDKQSLLKLMSNITNVRQFNEGSISEEDINMLFTAFSYGHSSIGNQARELIVLDDMELREKLVSCTLSPYLVKEKDNQNWLKTVPFLGIVIIESRRAIARVGEQGIKIAEKEAENALSNFRLMAASLDIGTTVVREFNPDKLKDTLHLPWYINVSSIIAAGYTTGHSKQEVQFPFEKIIHRDKWI